MPATLRCLPCTAALLLAFGACAGAGDRRTEAAGFTRADFESLLWLEGTWRGAAEGEPPFYEGYERVNDSTIRIHYFTDSTASAVADTGGVYLTAGGIFHAAGGGLWEAVRLDHAGIHFEPRANVDNAFTWTFESPTRWAATLVTPGRAAVVYRLERYAP